MKTLIVCLTAGAAAIALGGCVTTAEIEAKNAIADAGTCQSFGAQVGSPAYFQCRMTLRHERIERADRAAENLSRSLMVLGNSISNPGHSYSFYNY